MTTTTRLGGFATECHADLKAIDGLREAALASLAAARERGITADDARAFADDLARIENHCDYIRQQWFPDARELFVALGGAILVDRRGRHHIVWSKDHEKVA